MPKEIKAHKIPDFLLLLTAIFAMVMFPASAVHAASGDENWESIGSLPGVNGKVYAILRDGTNIYIGGEFTIAGDIKANGVAKWDGAHWSALGSGVGGTCIGNGCIPSVKTLVKDADGNIYVGGNFTTAGSLAANYIAKWNGTAWSALDTGLDSYPNAMIVDSGGRLLVAGGFLSAGGVTANRIAQWNGSSWSALGAGLDYTAYALALDSHQALYVGGAFSNAGGVNIGYGLAQWNGSSWSAVGAGVGGGTVYALLVAANDDLYVGGAFTAAGGATANSIAKWNGSDWSTLGNGMTGSCGNSCYPTVNTMIFDNSENLYVGGKFTTVGGLSANRIAKWDGSTWSALGEGITASCTFNTCTYPTDVEVYALSFGADGNLFAGGSFNKVSAAGGVGNCIARWDGSGWSAIQKNGFDSAVRASIIDVNGNLYVGGDFTLAPGGISVKRIAKWDGSVWTALGDGLSNSASAIAISANGDVYVGGSFITAGGVTVNRIARWDGSSWNALGSGLNNTTNALAFDSSGNLYAAGNFTNAGGIAANHIAKWNGNNWSAVGSGVSQLVQAMVIDANDNVYVGNTSVQKWNGSNWVTLSAGLSFPTSLSIKAMTLDASGNVYAGGGGGANPALIKWNGSSWSNAGSSISLVQSMAFDSAGNLFVGSNTATYIKKWNGSSWSALGSGVEYSGVASTSGTVSAVTSSNNGDVFVGGYFFVAGDKPASYFARWLGDFDNDGINNAIDVDDDGDSVPDYIDADAYNSSIIQERLLSSDAGYHGSAIREISVMH